MKQVMNCHKDNGLLNMIRRTDPMITKLEKTMGCLRASDEDMKTFKTFTDHLESTDSQEVPGKVFVKDDIEQYNKNRNE